MIYILGTTHDIQYGDDELKSPEFYSYLEKTIADLGITLLAEEVNEFNFQNVLHRMIVKELSLKLGLGFIMCEPEIEERSKYGLISISEISKCFEIANSDEISDEEKRPYIKIIDDNSDKREQIWFDRIKGNKDETILLVVGKDHVSKLNPRGRGIDTVLSKNGWDFTILPPFI